MSEIPERHIFFKKRPAHSDKKQEENEYVEQKKTGSHDNVGSYGGFLACRVRKRRHRDDGRGNYSGACGDNGRAGGNGEDGSRGQYGRCYHGGKRRVL